LIIDESEGKMKLNLKYYSGAGHVIPATWEAKIGRFTVQG
jgi:hypothetical protein